MTAAHDTRPEVAPPPFELTTFANDGAYDDVVVVSGIGFEGTSGHDGLPYRGVAHVAYVPRDRIVGSSELARLVEHVAGDAPTQEQLAARVGEVLATSIAARGTGVVVEATSWIDAGAHGAAARTVTTALRGALRHDASARAELLALTRPPRAH